MFELGRRYEFKMTIGGAETTFWGEIESYEHPLIKLADVLPEPFDGPEILDHEGNPIVEPPLLAGADKVFPGKIINVTSPNFISAVLDQD